MFLEAIDHLHLTHHEYVKEDEEKVNYAAQYDEYDARVHY